MTARMTYYCNDVEYPRKGKPSAWSQENKNETTMFKSYPVFAFTPGTKGDEQPKRYGDFVIDIDTKKIACEDAIKIVMWFQTTFGIEPEQWRIYLSGKKGVHLELPANVLGIAAGSVFLPLAYKRLAKELEGELNVKLDTSMYNMGTGKPYRQPNIMRDIGTCKRQIEYDDLYEILNPEDYTKACDLPGVLREPADTAVNEPLAVKLKEYLKDVEARQKEIANKPPMAKKDAEKLAANTPPCILLLKGITKQNKTETTFNEVAIQLTAYFASASFDEKTFLTVCKPFIENYPSTSLKTTDVRYKNCADRYRTMSANGYQHSCPAIKALKFGGYSCTECFMDETDVADDFKSVENDDKMHSPIGLAAYAINGTTMALRKNMKEAIYVMKGVAIRGQFTALAAPPNGGKTLFTIAMLIDEVKSGDVKGEDIFYINVDDNQEGAIVKTEVVEKYGINMVVPVLADPKKTNEQKFQFIKIIRDEIQEKSIDGKILVIDTYKKFASTMKKDQQSDFNDVLRQFVTAGGTVIVLAHVNKRKSEGKWVWGGTSDMKDDCDAAWIIDHTKSDKGITYEFIFQKGRGHAGNNISFFSPAHTHGTMEEDQLVRYKRLIDGLEPLSISEAKKEKMAANKKRHEDRLKSDCHQAILFMKELLEQGEKNRGEIDKEYKESDVRFDVARRDFDDVVKTFSGIMWDVRKSGNKKIYSLKTSGN